LSFKLTASSLIRNANFKSLKIGAFLCYNYALSKLPATRAAIFINGIPVVTAIAAWLLLGEKLTLIQVGGGALVLFAVGLTNWPNHHRELRKLQQTLPIS
jgi:drug/metabolite transporter (DMT)-like permease